MKKNIYVTQPSLPEFEEFIPHLKKIWDSKHVTNNGPFHEQFENELCAFLGVKHISVFCNGTIALLVAMKALRLTGEIITTPYTFVASTHAVKWNGLNPIFVDIEDQYCNINPEKIEEQITDRTTGIMPVHVYGKPCAVGKIQKITNKYDLKVVYDAAHAFGVRENGRSILNAGDLSVLSFHGTKVFNTFEGGAIVCHSEKMKKRIDDLKNFSIRGELSVTGLGINGKMNEFQAALGLLQLKSFRKNILARKKIDSVYRTTLSNVPGLTIPDIPQNTDYNYSYFPIFIDNEVFPISRDGLYRKLKKANIFSRRYFYPLVTTFPEYKMLPSAFYNRLPVAQLKSESVLCLPIYSGLHVDEAKKIASIIRI